VLSILMVPYQIYLIPQYGVIQNLGLLNTIAGIAAPGVFSAFGTFLMRQHFLSMPASLEEAARLDGANPWQTFWRIMFPLSGPALSAVAILTALASWNDLMWPLIAATYDEKTTLAVGLTSLQGPVHDGLPGDDGGELHGDAAADDPVHRPAAPCRGGARPFGHEGVSGSAARRAPDHSGEPPYPASRASASLFPREQTLATVQIPYPHRSR
jgi:hypothetical protein